MEAERHSARAPEREPRVMTSPMLKAMAHPLRRRIVAVLGAQESARAADLAQQLGVAANTLSFHLRTLADAGFVQEAPEFARDRRDRVWKAAVQSFRVGSPETPIGPEDEAPLTAYLDQLTMDQQEMVAKVTAWAPGFATGREPEAKADLSLGTLRLTPAEADELFTEVCAVLDRARSLHHVPAASDEADGVRAWDYTFMAAREDL
ncbi:MULTISPECIES: ArsR/SmtB family transcription factor [Micrococcaceae]|uniref:ArsR/SmtB family transcription factor n=1 Tax=Micrococcaceae TaxID=1268 RepID=UPI000BB81306|nr:helix-turn-helix domain-containing protein [Glutamicibacter sp. BW78]PCC25147.1 hypothetical protein CIK75_09005 [Glutamicibacter sp. BW78]